MNMSIRPILLFFFCFLIPFHQQASVIHVSNRLNIKNIQSAVTLAQPYDTIVIHKGIYKEKNIAIKQPLSIFGNNNPILDGDGKNEIMTIAANEVVIRGLTFQNSGYSSMNDLAAIKIIDAKQFNINNNTILNAHFGIHISNCDSFLISSNVIKGNPGEDEQSTGNGIHLWKCYYASIKNNQVSGHRDGIYFEFVENSTIANNYSYHNIRYGLHFMFSNNDQYVRNTFRENGAGVAVMFSHHIFMINNTFILNRGSSAYGLLLKEISDGLIKHNTFENNTTGIFMEGTNRIDVTNNALIKNGFAIRIQASCNNNTVKENNFIANTFDISTNGSLVLNNFNRNYWDKYQGYDLKHDGIGDVPYRPVSLFSMITENIPMSALLIKSFVVFLIDNSEKIISGITPENLIDSSPIMKPLKW